MAIGIVGDAGVRAVGQQDKIFVGMILILIFAEALGNIHKKRFYQNVVTLKLNLIFSRSIRINRSAYSFTAIICMRRRDHRCLIDKLCMKDYIFTNYGII